MESSHALRDMKYIGFKHQRENKQNSDKKSMNEITWHESAIWFFIAQKLLFANQYARKFHKISKFLFFQKISKL